MVLLDRIDESVHGWCNVVIDIFIGQQFRTDPLQHILTVAANEDFNTVPAQYIDLVPSEEYVEVRECPLRELYQCQCRNCLTELVCPYRNV